jgi:hypothetical protein
MQTEVEQCTCEITLTDPEDLRLTDDENVMIGMDHAERYSVYQGFTQRGLGMRSRNGKSILQCR